MLHTPKYDVRTRAFCGPTAISAVTGEPISVIRDAIRQASGQLTKSNGHARAVCGVSNEELIGAMHRLGWKLIETREAGNEYAGSYDKFRLGDFLDAHGNDGPYIVNVTGHYYAVSHGEICDTFTCLPKEIARFRRGRKRWVKRWFKFMQV